jgi:hypothetical protein
MIDFSSFRAYLDERQKRKYFINQNEIISTYEIEKIMELYREYNKLEIGNCFEPLKEDQLSSVFLVEAECEHCHSISIVEMTKTRLIDYLKRKTKKRWRNEYICENCKIKNKENEKQKKIEYIKREEENTKNFIDVYLDKNKAWNKELKFYDRWNSIVHSFVDWEIIANYINTIDYHDFLQTPYWKIIAEKKKRAAGFRCQLCNSSNNLSTHHRTYSIKGRELQNLKELIVICDECHKKHHNII